jgi:hypothetical protein
MIRRTRNIKKSVRAISVAAPAMPVNPKIAETIATMRKIRAQRNMVV